MGSLPQVQVWVQSTGCCVTLVAPSRQGAPTSAEAASRVRGTSSSGGRFVEPIVNCLKHSPTQLIFCSASHFHQMPGIST